MAEKDGRVRNRRRSTQNDALRSSEKHRRTHGPVYGTPSTESDPGEILLAEIQRTSGHIEWLRQRLNESDPDAFTHSLWLHARQSGWMLPSELDTRDWSQAGAMWVELYQSERKHLAAICRTALAAGIEERRVRLAERMAERISEAIQGMLYDLELDPEDDKVRAVVFRWLTMAQGLDPSPQPALAIES
jgi:hypothetical protein